MKRLNTKETQSRLYQHHLWLEGKWSEGQADFSGCNLKDIDFTGEDLRHINFSNCNLSQCDFLFCDLRGVNFQGANLSYADLSHCDLRNADFTGAKIRCTNFRRSNVAGCKFDESVNKNSYHFLKSYEDDEL